MLVPYLSLEAGIKRGENLIIDSDYLPIILVYGQYDERLKRLSGSGVVFISSYQMIRPFERGTCEFAKLKGLRGELETGISQECLCRYKMLSIENIGPFILTGYNR